jgi:hypothetical protein
MSALINFIPGAKQALAAGDTANTTLKTIFYFILIILSIVLLAGASKAQSTPKGKLVLALSVFIFLMTLALPFIARVNINTNQKVLLFYGVYFLLALMATIIGYKNSAELKSKKKDVKGADNAKRSATGIVVILGIFLFIVTPALFFMFDSGVNYWARNTLLLKPQI